MSEYVKELIDLSRDIEKRTNEAIKKIIPTKLELLDKAIEKIYSHYDTLLDSIYGKYYCIRFDLDNKKYRLVLTNNYKSKYMKVADNSRIAYIELDESGSNPCYILNAKTSGVCKKMHNKECMPDSYYAQLLKTSENKYHTNIIEKVTKYHNEIQEQIKKQIEEDIIKENLDNSKRISNEVELINTLDNFLN